MAGELGRDWSLPPLLPAGSPLFQSLPVGALVLDALAPAIGDGMITLSENGSEGVLVVRNGVVAERFWVANGVRSHGDEALALIGAADAAMVSARRLDDDAMGLLGALLHGSACYSDLRLEWVAWPQFLGELSTRGETLVVELTTPSGRGVTCIRGGRQVATFTDSHPALGDASLLDDLAAGGVGTVRVLAEDGAMAMVAHSGTPVVALADRYAAQPVSAKVGAIDPAQSAPSAVAAIELAQSGSDAELVNEAANPASVANALRREAPTAAALELPPAYVEPYVLPAGSDHAPPGSSRPLVSATDDPNATFSAMFGPHENRSAEQRFVALVNTRDGAERDAASLLPQLLLLVQHRLQRSAESVEEIVTSAASDHQSIGWLSDRVRVVTMRGFVHSTFDQLADDMLALAGRDPD
jgi:hypothetical protein